MRTPQQVWEGIQGIFANFAENWIIVIEAVFLFLLIYFVLKTLYETPDMRDACPTDFGLSWFSF